MTLTAGTTVSLEIAREVSPYGYFVTDGSHDVLLHYTEIVGSVKVGDKPDVFLYYDTEDRLAATMRKPLLELGQTALLRVADLHPRFGAFLDMGLGRELLLPYKEQPELKQLRPQVGDSVYAVMTHDKQGRLIARLAGEPELAPLVFHAPTAWQNEWRSARVYKSLQVGTFVVVDGGVLGFGALGMVHATERVGLPRVGEEIKVRVAFVREDGRVNLSMRAPKHVSQGEDADVIMAYLRERPNGSMPYSDATPSDIVTAKFNMSKGAFKRALGKLMKDGLIEQKENWTYLKKQDE
jgi:predicted RNA-binding protein (virulence factor B family)